MGARSGWSCDEKYIDHRCHGLYRPAPGLNSTFGKISWCRPPISCLTGCWAACTGTVFCHYTTWFSAIWQKRWWIKPGNWRAEIRESAETVCRFLPGSNYIYRKEFLMCEEKNPDIRAFFSNLSGPEPLNWKIKHMLRNNFLKLKTRENCCGHPGEPGC